MCAPISIQVRLIAGVCVRVWLCVRVCHISLCAYIRTNYKYMNAFVLRAPSCHVIQI